MQARAPLPVSILVPTRNSMSLLPAHIETLRELQPLAREIVVVDSESKDGTVELLRKEFPNARFLIHPPGLYESWNFGVNGCASEFVYISTVGDTISAEGLTRLVNTALELRCDVVISPPTLIDERGTRVTKSWPIYDLLGAASIKRATVFGPPETLLFAFAFLRKAILGSSASNVYRTEVLRARPFPTDFGHAGDVGWGLRHCGEIRLGIVPEWFSKFVFHPRAKRVVEDSEAIRIQAARETLAHVRERIAPDVLRAAENLCVAWEHLFATKARRQGTSIWILRPGGWRARMAENGAEADLLLRRGEALALIEQSLRA